MSTPGNLVPVAGLLGLLLLREIDEATADFLQRSDLVDVLVECGLVLPRPLDLRQLAAEYCETFLHPPDSLPPVQSLWEEGCYDGAASRELSKMAQALGLVRNETMAAAPADHIGSILSLWGELVSPNRDFATHLVEHHVLWAREPLRLAARSGGFYGQVAAAAGEFIVLLAGEHDITTVAVPTAPD